MFSSQRSYMLVAVASCTLILQSAVEGQQPQLLTRGQQNEMRTFEGTIDQKGDASVVVNGTPIVVNLYTDLSENGEFVQFRRLNEGDRVMIRARRSGGNWIADEISLNPDTQRGRGAGRISMQQFRDRPAFTTQENGMWSGQRQRGAVQTDQDIEESIRSELNWSPFVSLRNVDVQVRNGAAILTGTVDEWSAHGAATENAFEGGAREVRNLLRVRGYSIQPGRGSSYAARRDYYTPDDNFATTDREIQEDIETQLFWSPFVNDEQVRVTVRNGVATLTGQVDEWSGHGSATENAFEGGARIVRNQLRGPAADRVVVGVGGGGANQAVGGPDVQLEIGVERYEPRQQQRGQREFQQRNLQQDNTRQRNTQQRDYQQREYQQREYRQREYRY